jgi:hypothetical protein
MINVIYFRCELQSLYNLNYIPTTLGVKSWREITSGGRQTKKWLNTTDLIYNHISLSTATNEPHLSPKERKDTQPNSVAFSPQANYTDWGHTANLHN